MNETKQNRSGLAFGIVALVFILAMYTGWWLYLILYVPTTSIRDFSNIGTFGDSFGVVNALFSGLALVAIAFTLWQTQKQIKIQQKELEQNTKELKGQKEQLILQNQHLTDESIRSQFFRMLESWQKLIESSSCQVFTSVEFLDELHAYPENYYDSEWMSYRCSHLEGRSIFTALTSLLNEVPLSELDVTDRNILGNQLLNNFRNYYEKLYWPHSNVLGNYFRLLYHCVRFVHYAPISQNDKDNYIRILRAHLSQPELLLLLCNGVSQHGEKFYPLIENYNLLHNLGVTGISNRSVLLMYPVRCRQFNTNENKLKNESDEVVGCNYPFFVHNLFESCRDRLASVPNAPLKDFRVTWLDDV